MTLKDVLQHPWLLKEQKNLKELRDNSDSFVAFSLVNPFLVLKEISKKYNIK